MFLKIESGQKLKRVYALDENTEKVVPLLEKVLFSIETQLRVSIDLVCIGHEVTLMCDEGINPQIFEFVCLILERETKYHGFILKHV